MLNSVLTIHHLRFKQYEANFMSPAWVKSGYLGRMVGSWAIQLLLQMLPQRRTSCGSHVTTYNTLSGPLLVILSFALSCSQEFSLIDCVQGNVVLGKLCMLELPFSVSYLCMKTGKQHGSALGTQGAPTRGEGIHPTVSLALKEIWEWWEVLFSSTPFCPKLSCSEVAG